MSAGGSAVGIVGGVVGGSEMLGGCCVCADVVGYEENPLVYCDGSGCDVAVHQGCYGILAVPEESWSVPDPELSR